MSQLNHRHMHAANQEIRKQAKLLLASEQVSLKTICPSSKSGNLQKRNILLSCQLWPAISSGLALLSYMKREMKEHSLYSWQDRKYNHSPHRSHTAVAISQVKQTGLGHKFCCFKRKRTQRASLLLWKLGVRPWQQSNWQTEQQTKRVRTKELKTC